jgi:hypothetical protein
METVNGRSRFGELSSTMMSWLRLPGVELSLNLTPKLNLLKLS